MAATWGGAAPHEIFFGGANDESNSSEVRNYSERRSGNELLNWPICLCLSRRSNRLSRGLGSVFDAHRYPELIATATTDRRVSSTIVTQGNRENTRRKLRANATGIAGAQTR